MSPLELELLAEHLAAHTIHERAAAVSGSPCVSLENWQGKPTEVVITSATRTGTTHQLNKTPLPCQLQAEVGAVF